MSDHEPSAPPERDAPARSADPSSPPDPPDTTDPSEEAGDSDQAPGAGDDRRADSPERPRRPDPAGPGAPERASRFGQDGNRLARESGPSDPSEPTGAPRPAPPPTEATRREETGGRPGPEGDRRPTRGPDEAPEGERVERQRREADAPSARPGGTAVPGGGGTQGERFRLPNPPERRSGAPVRPRPTLPGDPSAPAPRPAGRPGDPAGERGPARPGGPPGATPAPRPEDRISPGPAPTGPANPGSAPSAPTNPGRSPAPSASAGGGAAPADAPERSSRPPGAGADPASRGGPVAERTATPADRVVTPDGSAPAGPPIQRLQEDTAALEAVQTRERTRAPADSDAPTVATPLGPARVEAEAAPAADETPADETVTTATRRVRRIGIGSVFKVALAFYFAVFLVMLALAVVLWLALSTVGVISNIESFFGELFGYDDFRFLGTRILQIVVLVGLLWVVVAAAATSLLAFLYNRVARFVGGISMTVEDVAH